jgi:hypothetical protein
MLRRTKHSKIEVAAPKEKEEALSFTFITAYFGLMYIHN